METLEDLRKRYAEERAKRDAIQTTKSDDAERAALLQKLEDEPHIRAAVEEYGAIDYAIAVLHTRSGAVVVKRPRQAVWRRFSDANKLTGKEIYTLVQSCKVYPDNTRFEKILDEHPAALESLGLMVTKLASVDADDTAGK